MKRLMVHLAVVAAVAALIPTALARESGLPDACDGSAITDHAPTDVNDYLSGTEGSDIAALGKGDDQYFAGEGNDLLCGNQDADVLVGEFGADVLFGGPGADTLLGSFGADNVIGQSGDDELRVGFDGIPDVISDGRGRDVISGGREDLWLRCEDGVVDDHDAFEGTTLLDPDCFDDDR